VIYNFLDTESSFSQLQIQPDDEMRFYKQLCSAKSSSADKGEVFFDWAAKFLLLLPTSVSYMFYYPACTDKLDFSNNTGASE